MWQIAIDGAFGSYIKKKFVNCFSNLHLNPRLKANNCEARARNPNT